MALGNFTAVAWNGKEVMELNQAIMDDIYKNPSINDLHTVIEGIVAKQQIVFLSTMSKLTKADAGCGSGNVTSSQYTATDKFWEPARTKVWLQECADNLESTFFVWALGKSISRNDLTMGDFATFMKERMTAAMAEDLLRIVWFGDTAAANVDDSPAGVITSGVSVTDYTLIDGLWKQIYTAVSGDAARRYTISKNAQSTYATQALAAGDSYTIFSNLMTGADARLKSAANKVIYCTTSIYENYIAYLESKGVSEGFNAIVNGIPTLNFRGVPVKVIDLWDRTIVADMDNGSAWYQPHRAVLTVKENIPVGLDAQSGSESVDLFYDPTTELTNFKAKYKLDTKLLKEYMIQVAY